MIIETPIHLLPVFVKGGAILPMQRPVQNTKENVNELILHVYQGTSDTGFDFYEDDGVSYQFESGSFAKRKIAFSPSSRKITLGKSEGNYVSTLKNVKLVLHQFDTPSLVINGQKQNHQKVLHSFFQPLEKYDPINDPDSMGEEEVIVKYPGSA